MIYDLQSLVRSNTDFDYDILKMDLQHFFFFFLQRYILCTRISSPYYRVMLVISRFDRNIIRVDNSTRISVFFFFFFYFKGITEHIMSSRAVPRPGLL